MIRLRRVLPALVLSCLAAATWAQAERPPAAVTVVTMQPETVTLTTTLPGRVLASAEAEVRPQVAGVIIERLFTEGGRVEAGDELYRIDPASYEAALAQAEASVAQAQAQLDAAEREAARVQTLLDRNVASQQVVDDATAARDAAQAALQVAEAGLRSAQIELDRTIIRARLSGEIGLSRTSRGALVTASQAEPLAVIRNIDPVYVDVTQSAADLLAWRRGHVDQAMQKADRTVTLTLPDGEAYDQTGTLTAAEPHVDEQTGVVMLRMEFDNPEKLLLPGMYVQVEMPTGTAEGVFLAPQEGVSRDRRGRPTALVVNAENVVEERQLTVLQDRGAHWVVSDGLQAGDRLIVAGLQKTAPGATVTPEERARNADTAQGDAPVEKADASAAAETATE
ncbi:efflux RND transporter periplasmic adaptor subunit [Tranquillimonas alkanivorans]|uniref:Membrane fusion protein, multidrug efflux system n=1 Tax=Tranquillimonas alkanivorans TaxID=441119 RepID=A0A1I5VML3_9RHOB|nr:efflux RND transporter periplasmic adaptor subunit [Tranquillimonas alkanivorans]SFQ08794.1 membrane fusion protein, multidrug efflux system [Tranquillimonas alkanivorans]